MPYQFVLWLNTENVIVEYNFKYRINTGNKPKFGLVQNSPGLSTLIKIRFELKTLIKIRFESK